ncbi:MAG: hypothetical protein RLZZ214_3936 [Verrucomicrobiota bacterium]|jgi:uncharacterized lipoprotein YajG
MKTKTACLALATAVLLTSCDKKETSVTATSTNAPSAALSAVLAAAPTGEPKPIHLIRATAKPGDDITVSGRIMGNEKPFVTGRSAFILGDPEVLTACNEDPADKCATPWDACCDSPEDKKRGIATIQIVGADGRVLKESIEGVGGLANLATVTVSGKVAEGSSADALIINAQAIRSGK